MSASMLFATHLIMFLILCSIIFILIVLLGTWCTSCSVAKQKNAEVTRPRLLRR